MLFPILSNWFFSLRYDPSHNALPHCFGDFSLLVLSHTESVFGVTQDFLSGYWNCTLCQPDTVSVW